MKKLLVLSGKGGTGKTTVAASFIKLSNAKAFADCDVDAPNLHLVMKLKNEPIENDFWGMEKSSINQDKCTKCGKCLEHCRFNAIEIVDGKYQVNEFACEGCGLCSIVCPENAVKMVDDVAGKTYLYTDDNVFSTAKLKMGRGNSGKLVTAVKQQLPEFSKNDLAIYDGSPGIGCPVIASISGVDYVLIVAEPSLSGISDFKRIVETSQIFNTKIFVCVNKSDLCAEKTNEIEKYCMDNKLDFVGEIPYDKTVIEALKNGKSIIEYNSLASDAIKTIYKKVINLI